MKKLNKQQQKFLQRPTKLHSYKEKIFKNISNAKILLQKMIYKVDIKVTEISYPQS